ncbi:unnamed protein product [Diamesa serratosioi]
MAFNTLIQGYYEIPIVTRVFTSCCVATTIAVHLDLVSPFQLYFNPTLILQGQIWRLLTTFLFFGTIGFTFLFNMIFTYRYCRMLEETSFRGKTADFIVMFMFGAFFMVIFAFFINLLFLGQAFTIMLVYVWSRRNPFLRMNFFGLLNFQAPYLPWVLLAFSVILGNAIYIDLVGMAAGHLYYFLEDVFPNQPNGKRLLKTPMFLRNLFDEPQEDADYDLLPEDRPGGFQWGAGAAAAAVNNDPPVAPPAPDPPL